MQDGCCRAAVHIFEAMRGEGRKTLKGKTIMHPRRSRRGAYSHSMVPGGLDVTSRTTRFTSRTSLVMRVEMRASTS